MLNFGLPAPVDIQIEGTDIEGNREVAARMLQEVERVPGVADARIQQAFDYPEFDVAVDRTKAAQGGYTQRDVANSLLNSLSGSFQITPMFFLNWKNGVSYNLVTQTPQYSIQSLEDLQNTPLNASTAARPEILADVASIKRSNEMEVVSHYNIRRVVDIYAAVQGRDLGAVGREVTRIVDANRKSLPRGSFVTIRGQLQTMRSSYLGLLGGLIFSVVLVYLLIVVNFQSWLDPFIIITALPGRACRHRRFLVLHAYNTQRSGLDGRRHVHGRRNREQYSCRVFCERTASAPRRSGRSGHRSRLHQVSPCADDRSGHDHRHDPHGTRAGRGRRAECAAGPRRNWRPVVRHCSHIDLRPRGLQLASRTARSLSFTTTVRGRASTNSIVEEST